ncbi:hypothetical protein AB0F81_28955 [Actinoplanes sp. NPDC024001]|uniref:hypothetical protein n=1 Tax=Actinoplanes sp. NPDC024001 TaxID=3154598 RepID=UPI00340D4097
MPHLGPQRYVPGQSRPYPPPQSGSPVPPHWWWFVVPLATFGFGTFAMVWIAGTRLATRRTTMAAAGYAASAFLTFLLIIVGSPDGVLGGLTALLLLMLWFGGTAHVAVLQTRVRQLDAGTPAPPVVTHADDPGIAAAQWRQQRRREARELLLTNPGMAAELRIGRPDVPDRSYRTAAWSM